MELYNEKSIFFSKAILLNILYVSFFPIFFIFFRHSPSNLSGISPFDGSCCGGNSSYNDLSSGESSVAEEIPKYRVVLLGESGVGKTALVSQFMTSEYMNTYDASLGKTVV